MPGGDSKKRKLTPETTVVAACAALVLPADGSSFLDGLFDASGAYDAAAAPFRLVAGDASLAVLEAAFDGLDGLSSTDGGAVDADAAAVARACGDGGADAAAAAAALRIRVLKGLKRLLEDGRNVAADEAARPGYGDFLRRCFRLLLVVGLGEQSSSSFKSTTPACFCSQRKRPPSDTTSQTGSAPKHSASCVDTTSQTGSAPKHSAS